MLTSVIYWYIIYAERNQQILILILRQVGGSMGLWLGLGVLQILQHIITITGPIIKKCYFKALKKTWNLYQIAHFFYIWCGVQGGRHFVKWIRTWNVIVKSLIYELLTSDKILEEDEQRYIYLHIWCMKVSKNYYFSICQPRYSTLVPL